MYNKKTMEKRKILELQHDRKILNTNDAAAWGWDSSAGKLRLQRRADLVNNFVKSRIEANKKDSIKILELGCGTGLFTEKLVHFSSGIFVSLDIYDGFIYKAIERMKKAGKSHIFLVGDAEALPFLDESFDVVAGISVLHHLKFDIALKNISRILKPGGIFIFSEPNMLNPQILIQKNIPFIKRCLGDSPCEKAFFPFGFRSSFLRNNLTVEIIPFDFLHPATPKNLVPIVSKAGAWLERHVFLKYIAGSLLIYGEKIKKGRI